MTATTRALYDPEALTTVALQRLSLRVTAGPDEGQVFLLQRRTTTIGSDPDLAVSLADEAVSRRHACLEHTARGLRVRDLDSTNGTFVDGVQVQSAFVPVAGVVRVGASELRLEIEGETDDQTVNVDLYNSDRLVGLLGESEAMHEVFGLVARVAPADVTVLVTGESGTGKELVAEALHQLSGRAKRPFVVFDCSAVPAELIESELFGHLKGAFTGASAARSGAFRQAHKGTIFLDEIGELSPSLQPKLLRVLESRSIKPVGGERVEEVDVRVVAATNRNLGGMVRDGDFREDLYFRLAHIEIDLPPLRERVMDIPTLVQHFLAEVAPERGVEVSYQTMQRLMEHPWPGNVRELKNYVERAALLSREGRIETRFLGPAQRADKGSERAPSAGGDGGGAGLPVHYDLPFKDAKQRLVEAFEGEYWRRMLGANKWNISAAARAAGIHRKSLEYVVRKLGLKDQRDA